jgi:histidine triad (HIT) family protein
MDDCIFCRIIAGQIQSDKVFENEFVFAFKDINPVAPVHILIMPKQHIVNMNDIDNDNSFLIAEIHLAAVVIARKYGISQKGYRLINNCGSDAGQTVAHLHYHLIGGRLLGSKLL